MVPETRVRRAGTSFPSSRWWYEHFCQNSIWKILVQIDAFFWLNWLHCTSLHNSRGLSGLPPFCSAVLEPRFHLGVRHFQIFGQRSSLGRGEVFLLVKPFLQLGYLQPGEWGSGLFSFRRCSVLVRMSYPSGHRKSSCKQNKLGLFSRICYTSGTRYMWRHSPANIRVEKHGRERGKMI